MRLREFDEKERLTKANEKLKRYKTAAGADATAADAEGNFARGHRRFKGINAATKKQFDNDAKLAKLKEVAPPGDRAERMVRHIKQGYARDGKLTPKEKSIAFATAWKAHNAGRVEEQGVAEDKENYNGINILLQKDDDELFVKASAGSRELGHVLFVIDGEYLMPQDLEVEEKFRGQGIAQTMYDYVKSKGYKIRRSGQQTDAGAGFWDKHRPEQNVWEQGVAEEKKPDFMKAGNMKPFKVSGEEIPGAVRTLEKVLLKAKERDMELNYTNIDKMMQAVCKKHNLTGDELHNEFVSKHHMIPDDWIVKQLDENLHQWFKEKWVRFGPDGKIRGDCARGSESEGKPKCLPQSKAHSLGKKGRASAAARKRREDPNANRSGKAINVSTKGKGK
jgi:hypothetical protein